MAETLELRALLAPIAGSHLLLPGSVVAEVVAYIELERYPESPDWLLGELQWNGWQIPVVNYSQLAATSMDDAVSPRSRILVVKTLSEATRVQYIGMIISGMPRLKTLSAANVVETGADTPDGVFSYVTVDEQAAVIPDLDALASNVEQAVY